MVVMRYVLGASTVWQTEFVTFAIVASTFIGSPYVLLHKGHVNVDLAVMYVNRRWRLPLAYLASVASLVFCLTVAWYGWLYFHEALQQGWRTETVWALPLWIPLLPLPLGMGLLSLQFIADILCLITGREAPFGMDPEDAE
jgi:TRAP-type C4-dicarboxylate transport system permease small subunit